MREVKRRTINGETYQIMIDPDSGLFAVELGTGLITRPTLAELEAALEAAAKKPKTKAVPVTLLGLRYDQRMHMGRVFADDPETIIECELRGRHLATHALLLTVAGAKITDGGYDAKAHTRICRRLTVAEKAMYLRRRATLEEAKKRLVEFEKSVGMGDVDVLLLSRVKK